MTERTIRNTAKELAGAYWEEEHSERFRKFWPRCIDFQNRNWPTFVPLAREIMVSQLNDKNVPEPMKEAIAKALIEDREKEVAGQAMAASKVGYAPNFVLNPEHPGPREKKIFYDE